MPKTKKVVEMDSLEVMQEIEKQKDRPFVGAKVYEHMEFNTSHSQGDVEIIKIQSMPPMEELEEIKNWNGVLAQGLADGNDHKVLSLDGLTAYNWKKATPFIGPFVRAIKTWSLMHKNHKAATFPAGDYQIEYPQEYNLGLIRRTMD
ncbi:MAG: hypothetical protein KGL39_31985 [Patescibacteria group bacterium]|nr:hypothetical protein [Patescibacteria group bacterium]